MSDRGYSNNNSSYSSSRYETRSRDYYSSNSYGRGDSYRGDSYSSREIRIPAAEEIRTEGIEEETATADHHGETADMNEETACHHWESP